MAKEKKEKKVCDNCGENTKDCGCDYKKYPKGSYGLTGRDVSDDDESDQTNAQMGGMDESLKAPGHKQLDGFSREKKKKKLDAFKAQADEAKAREKDKEKKHSLYKERKERGIRFYDAKGSGYIKGGKKTYD